MINLPCLGPETPVYVDQIKDFNKPWSFEIKFPNQIHYRIKGKQEVRNKYPDFYRKENLFKPESQELDQGNQNLLEPLVVGLNEI